MTTHRPSCSKPSWSGSRPVVSRFHFRNGKCVWYLNYEPRTTVIVGPTDAPASSPKTTHLVRRCLCGRHTVRVLCAAASCQIISDADVVGGASPRGHDPADLDQSLHALADRQRGRGQGPRDIRHVCVI